MKKIAAISFLIIVFFLAARFFKDKPLAEKSRLVLSETAWTKENKPNPIRIRAIGDSIDYSVLNIIVLRNNGSRKSGSCFVIEFNGTEFLATNEHVVTEAKKIWVRLDGDTAHFPHPAKLWATDKEIDCALLVLDPADTTFIHNLKPIKLGDSDKLKGSSWHQTNGVIETSRGDRVKTIGWPYDFPMTHEGIIINPRVPGPFLGLSYPTVIVSEVIINPGSSGSPLLNENGEVIGINFGVKPATSFLGQGGGFSLTCSSPINDFRLALPRLALGGEIKHADTGLDYFNSWETPKDIYSIFNLNPPENQGVVVSKVDRDSPAEKSGIMSGDVILQIENTPVRSTADLRHFEIFDLLPEMTVKIEILRGTERKIVQLTAREKKSFN